MGCSLIVRRHENTVLWRLARWMIPGCRARLSLMIGRLKHISSHIRVICAIITINKVQLLLSNATWGGRVFIEHVQTRLDCVFFCLTVKSGIHADSLMLYASLHT